MSIRFSLHGSVRKITDWIQRSRRVEELGYEGLFIADAQMTCLEPFQTLAVCAGQTKRIRLGTAVTNIVYRDPLVMASSAVTLNEISDGQAVLGMGTGTGPVYGLGRKATSIARFEEGLKTIRELVQGRPIAFPTGKKVPIRIGKFPVPIYLSVEGPRGLQVAGRVADGVILGNGFDLRVLQWAREQIAKGAREAGRSPSDIDIMPAGMICVDENGDQARAVVRGRISNRVHHNFRSTMETVPPEELASVKKFMEVFDITKPLEERGNPELITDYLTQRFSIAGTTEECVARVKKLEEAGVRCLMVTPPDRTYSEIMETWAKEVMPHFKT